MDRVRHWTFFMFIWLTLVSSSSFWAQNPAYYFEGDEVVFVFDIRDYQYAVDQSNQEYLDFSDLDIYDVAISGDFNEWSKRGWRMKKKNKYIFELRKEVSDFSDQIDWNFKYVINGKHIISQALSFKDRLFDRDFFKDAFGLDINPMKINKEGSTRFYLGDHENAKKVILTGSFNNWDEDDIEMMKVNGGWELRCDLPPGIYEYKFIVDGAWTDDPDNPDKKVNEYSTYNSILSIKVDVDFKLSGFDDAKDVILAGSFNDWNEHEIHMEKKDGKWQTSMMLAGGKHHYKFIVDGTWYVDPANPIWEDDGRGNINSVLFVR